MGWYTILTKPITRECTRAKVRERPILITLEPGDTLAFREKGRKTTYRLPIYTCFILAADAYARAQMREKKRNRKNRRKS